MIPNLTLVTLGVADLERATRFYTDVGFELATPPEGVAFFQTGGSILALFPHDELAADAHVSAEGSGFAGLSLASNQETREAVDDAFARWVAAGAIAVKRPEEVFWGGYSSYVRDPDGHLWEIAHNPFWTFDEHGRWQP